MSTRITDASVDREGRLTLTIKQAHRQFLTFRLDEVEIEESHSHSASNATLKTRFPLVNPGNA